VTDDQAALCDACGYTTRGNFERGKGAAIKKTFRDSLSRAVQKRLNRLRCRLMCWVHSKEACIRRGAQWRHVANTTEPSMTDRTMMIDGHWQSHLISSHLNDVDLRAPKTYHIANLICRTEPQQKRLMKKTKNTRMWANAQRDGRPAEYRWRPLFNAAKFG